MTVRNVPSCDAGLMMSRAGDIRCNGCALVDNLRAGVELNRLSAPYNTTGTMNGTIIAVNSRAMKPFTTSATAEAESENTRKRSLRDTADLDTLPPSGLPHFQRDDPDKGNTFGWCATCSQCQAKHSNLVNSRGNVCAAHVACKHQYQIP